MADSAQPAQLESAQYLLDRLDDPALKDNLAALIQNQTCVIGIYDVAVQSPAIGSVSLLDTAGNAIILPAGCLVKQVAAIALAGVTATGSATVSLGWSGSTAALVGVTAKTDLEVGEKVAGVATGVAANMIYTASQRSVLVTIATDALLTGRVAFILEFYKLPL